MCAMDVFKKTPRAVCASLSTVYRILNQLTEAGILQASLEQDESTYYEMKGGGHHHYIVCARCGKLAPIDDCPLDALDEHIMRATGYAITGHRFQLEDLPGLLKKIRNRRMPSVPFCLSKVLNPLRLFAPSDPQGESDACGGNGHV